LIFFPCCFTEYLHGYNKTRGGVMAAREEEGLYCLLSGPAIDNWLAGAAGLSHLEERVQHFFPFYFLQAAYIILRS
jgi:hypothetical protein